MWGGGRGYVESEWFKGYSASLELPSLCLALSLFFFCPPLLSTQPLALGAARKVHLFERGDRQGKAKDKAVLSLDDPLLESAIGRELYAKLMEDAALLADLIEPLDLVRVASGDQSPIFFGSAMNNFGVELFLEKFLRMGCTPGIP